MLHRPLRREFLGAAAGVPAIPAALGGAQAGRAPGRSDVEAEIRRRAARYVPQRYLEVNYYRIRRRVAYPLPVASLSLRSIPVPGISEYPWATWMTWELEERINSLGWAAEWFKNAEYARAASADLEALAAWPKYCQYKQPDLSSGHAGRILWTAHTKWRWPAAALREKIRAACARHASEVAPLADAYYGQARTKEDFLAMPEPGAKLVNIPIIGTLTAALTASAAGHPAAAALSSRAAAVLGAILEMRSKGQAEAVAYDGYVLDFAAEWLGVASEAERQAVLTHPNLRHYLDESYMLGAPGAIQQVAELADVEPREMPFHFSAHAKLARYDSGGTRAWLLRRWPLDWVPAPGLAALRAAGTGAGSPPEAGALNAHYATVLRTGWEGEDLAMAMSCTNSAMSHLPPDNGTLVIGTRGRWIITDPGYQQYMRDPERDFTLGPTAHNYPVIGGVTQNAKKPRLAKRERVDSGLLRASVELADCYPASAGVKSVLRTVWVSGRDLVVVADRIEPAPPRAAYHWHGHPDAAWWSRDGWMLLHLPDADLWFTSPQAKLSDANIQRLPGSRGQLTAVADADASGLVWWVFALAAEPPRVEASGGGLQVGGKRFAV